MKPYFPGPTLVGVAMVVIATLGLSSCGNSEGNSVADSDAQGTSTPGPTSKDGDLAHRMIVEPLKAIGATKVAVDDDSVRATFAGSRDAPAAWTKCSAMQAVAGDKASIMVYSDGELDCADRLAD